MTIDSGGGKTILLLVHDVEQQGILRGDRHGRQRPHLRGHAASYPGPPQLPGHPSKALSNVFPEKRRDGILAGLHMPVCRFVLAITGRRTLLGGIESFAHSRTTTNFYDA